MKLAKKGNRIYLDNLWYMIEDSIGEYNVYDDGEYEGKYCGSLKTLEGLSKEDALDYVLRGL